MVSGIPGSPTEDYGVPFALTEEFVAVYRMHQLIPDDFDFRSATDDRATLGPKEFDQLVLTKYGNNTLVLANTGTNTFSGGIAINAGTVQFGNGGTGGNLPANAQPITDKRKTEHGEGDCQGGEERKMPRDLRICATDADHFSGS